MITTLGGVGSLQHLAPGRAEQRAQHRVDPVDRPFRHQRAVGHLVDLRLPVHRMRRPARGNGPRRPRPSRRRHRSRQSGASRTRASRLRPSGPRLPSGTAPARHKAARRISSGACRACRSAWPPCRRKPIALGRPAHLPRQRDQVQAPPPPRRRPCSARPDRPAPRPARGSPPSGCRCRCRRPAGPAAISPRELSLQTVS